MAVFSSWTDLIGRINSQAKALNLVVIVFVRGGRLYSHDVSLGRTSVTQSKSLCENRQLCGCVCVWQLPTVKTALVISQEAVAGLSFSVS